MSLQIPSSISPKRARNFPGQTIISRLTPPKKFPRIFNVESPLVPSLFLKRGRGSIFLIEGKKRHIHTKPKMLWYFLFRGIVMSLWVLNWKFVHVCFFNSFFSIYSHSYQIKNYNIFYFGKNLLASAKGLETSKLVINIDSTYNTY